MKRKLTAILCLIAVLGMSAKEWNFDRWPDIDPQHTLLLSSGAVSPDGIVQITFEKGSGSEAPVMSESGITMTLHQGNLMRIKLLKPGYSLRRIIADTSFHPTLRGAIASVGDFVNLDDANWRDSSAPRAFWSYEGLGYVTEITITPKNFKSDGTADYFPPFSIEYDPDGTVTTPMTRYIPGELTRKSTSHTCNSLFSFRTPEPNTQVRYEVYKYIEGMSEPDVTLDSKLFNPSDSLLYYDLDFENELDANTYIRIAARSYVEGMQPSDVVRSCQIQLSHIIKSAADFPETKASGYYDTKLVYKGKATVFAICPGFYGSTRTEGNTTYLTTFASPNRNRYYMIDESGVVFRADGSNQLDKWIDVKVGDVITGITGEYYVPDMASATQPVPPRFTLTRYDSGRFAKVKQLPDETPIEVPIQECTPATFAQMENFKPIVMKGVKYYSQSSNYYSFGTSSNRVQGYFVGSSIQTPPAELKIPANQGVDIYGIKTGEKRFDIIRWEVAKVPAEEPYLFPYDNFFAEDFEVPSNQTVSIKLYEELDNDIRYTLDGSDPTEQSTLYTEPFMLPQDQDIVTVKARSFESNHLPSSVVLCNFIRTGLKNAYFALWNPESLGATPGSNVADGTTLMVNAGNALVKMTLTAPDASHPVKFTTFQGKNVLYMPTGTRLDFESTCDIRTIRFEEIEGYSISQWLEIQDRDYSFHEKYNSTDCEISKYDADDIITNVSLKTIKNRNFNFESIHVIVDDRLESPLDVKSIAEAQVADNGRLLAFATHVIVNHVYNDEVYASDDTGALLIKMDDTSKLAAGNRIVDLTGRMIVDQELGYRYFQAEIDELVISAGSAPSYPETKHTQLAANYWRPVTLKNVKLSTDLNGVTYVVNDDNDMATLDYHFGDLQIPLDRYCDIVCIPRAGIDGMTLAPISYVKLHVAPQAITLDKTEIAMIKGETLTLTATVLPEDADDKTVTWTSSDEEIATVDSEGLVTALKSGEVTITATTAENHDLKAECKVTITTPVASITLDKTEVAMIKGETLTLTATVLPEDADDKTVTWTSSDEEIATVDSEGLVTAMQKGTAIITAADPEGHTASCIITIENILPTAIILSESSAEILKGQTLQLTAEIIPEDAFDKTIVWSSDNVSIASVDDTGLVTALEEGVATISATALANDDITASCIVTVKKTGGVSTISADGAVTVYNRTLTINGFDGTLFSFYNSNGLLLASILGNGETITETFEVPSGVYFLSSNDGKVHMKIYIR